MTAAAVKTPKCQTQRPFPGWFYETLREMLRRD